MKRTWIILPLLVLTLTSSVRSQDVLSNGHIDVMQVTYSVISGFSVQINNDSTATVYQSQSGGPGRTFDYPNGGAVFRIDEPHLAVRPLNANWDFIGVGPGVNFRATPQNGDVVSRLEMGIATDTATGGGIPPGIFVGDQITVSLITKIGPGEFSLYTTSSADFNDPVSGNPTVAISTFAGINTFMFGTGSHADLNLAFTLPGSYDIDLQFSGVLQSSMNNVSSQVHRFHFDVTSFAIPEPTTWLLIAGTIGITAGCFMSYRRRLQREVDLEPAEDAETLL